MISVYQERFFAWHQSLSARERKLLAVMTLLIACCAVYYGVWVPTSSRLSEAQRDYREQWDTLQWMRANAPSIQPPTGTAAPDNDTTPLPVLLTQTAKKANVPIARLNADADDKVTLTLESVPFNRLILWLDELQRANRVVPLSATISAGSTPGQVSATLQLEK